MCHRNALAHEFLTFDLDYRRAADDAVGHHAGVMDATRCESMLKVAVEYLGMAVTVIENASRVCRCFSKLVIL